MRMLKAENRRRNKTSRRSNQMTDLFRKWGAVNSKGVPVILRFERSGASGSASREGGGGQIDSAGGQDRGERLV